MPRTKLMLMSLLCSLSAGSALGAEKDVKDGLSALKKAAIFASRNTEQQAEQAATEAVEVEPGADQADEVIFKKASQPWLTNEPYLADEYSQQYASAKESHDKGKDTYAAECFEKHKNGEDAAFWKSKCEMLAISNHKPFKMPRRGSIEYVKEHYMPIKKLSSRAFAAALKSTLEDLSTVRENTRIVGGIISSELQPGELSYEQVNSEICLIEKLVGRLSTKDYCHS